MLNFLWAGMIVIGMIYAAFTGRLSDVANAAIDSSREAVNLCITMIGVISLWLGVMEIATKAGLIQRLAGVVYPVTRLIFPEIPRDHRANEYITTNFVANILGLGWAATPAGLQAMEALEQLEEERRKKAHRLMRPKGEASNEMCTFLILNISSLQLIPVNVIAYRSQYGSVNPAEIVTAGLIATTISTVTAIIYCKIKVFSLTFLDSKRRQSQFPS